MFFTSKKKWSSITFRYVGNWQKQLTNPMNDSLGFCTANTDKAIYSSLRKVFFFIFIFSFHALILSVSTKTEALQLFTSGEGMVYKWIYFAKIWRLLVGRGRDSHKFCLTITKSSEDLEGSAFQLYIYEEHWSQETRWLKLWRQWILREQRNSCLEYRIFQVKDFYSLLLPCYATSVEW